jgi:hypothetical protein
MKDRFGLKKLKGIAEFLSDKNKHETDVVFINDWDKQKIYKIDFNKHDWILDKLKSECEKEIRTEEEQILMILTERYGRNEIADVKIKTFTKKDGGKDDSNTS